MLHPDVATRAPELARVFAQAKPFRHVVVEPFLQPEALTALMGEFPAFAAERARNELGEVGRKAVVPGIRTIGPAYRAFDELLRSQSLLDLLGQITGIEKLLYDQDYVGGGTHENLHGQDLDLHIDFNYHPARGWHRRLNLILFLNEEWRPEWGGCLELHRDPWHPDQDEVAKVTPVANRAVLFETTERSWHGFPRIHLPADRQQVSRKSVAVYYYTAERPAAETAAPHGTVYVPQPLPGRWQQPGHTLTAEDVWQLQVLWERRNAQLRFLYERELEFSAALRAMRESASFRLGRMLTWPLRVLRRR